ncbi:MAG: flagellar hook-basal body complex protein [Myxococcales bacterium]|nr:flagellar hook-basal body complex protein [Myxococcales bacterium]
MHKELLVVLLVCGCGVERPSTDSLSAEPCTNEGHWAQCDPIARGKVVMTGVATDLAIDGYGYFPVVNRGQLLLTRDGAFTIDFDSHLVSRDGYALQGFAPGSIVASDLTITPTTLLASPTSQVSMRARLDPNAPMLTFDPLNPTATSNFSASVTAYDSLGSSFDVTVYFNRTASGSWDFHAMVPDGAALTGGTAGQPAEFASGAMTFDTLGRLDTITQSANFNPLNSVNPQPLHFNFGDELVSGGTGLSGVVQNVGGNGNELTFTSQDGSGAGSLKGVSIDRQGSVLGEYSNGHHVEVARVALVRVSSPNLLRHVGGKLFAPKDSTRLLVGLPGDGLFGSIRSGALEHVCE